MRVLHWAVPVAALIAVSSCSTSTGPGQSGDLPYPDIPGLVVFYEFDGDLTNAVSDEHHGASSREISYVEDRHGAASSAVYVVSDTIHVPDHPDLDITGAITLAAWVNPEFSYHAYNAVIDKNYNEAYSLGMHGAVSPDTVGLIGYISDNSLWVSNAVPYGTDTWTHIAFTFVDSTGRGEFYLNGDHAGGMNSSTTLGICDKMLRIGVAYYGDRYKGAIDQVAIFGRALSPAEVGELFSYE